jgi:hypothetical protein
MMGKGGALSVSILVVASIKIKDLSLDYPNSGGVRQR